MARRDTHDIRHGSTPTRRHRTGGNARQLGESRSSPSAGALSRRRRSSFLGESSHAPVHADHRGHHRPRVARPALGDPAGGMAVGGSRGAAARPVTTHRALRQPVRPRHRRQGDRRDGRLPRVRDASQPPAPGGAVRDPHRRHHRTHGPVGPCPQLGARHRALGLLTSLPRPVQPVHAPRNGHASDRRSGGSARAPAPARLLLGGCVPVQHAVPTRRGGLRRLPRRR